MAYTTIPIVFTFDKNWVLAAAVCFHSMLKNKKDATCYEFIVIHKDIPPKDQLFLQKRMQLDRSSSLRFIEIDKNIINKYTLTQRKDSPFTMDCYTRLFLPDILPGYDRVIYSDVDVVVLGDLGEVFNNDLNQNFLGVVKDVRINKRISQNNHSDFGIKYFGKYFYSGFLIMDLDALRDHNMVEELSNIAQSTNKLPDQDVLNKGCLGKVEYLHQKYTVLTSNLSYDDSVLDEMGIRQEYAEALTEPVIYHYAGREKPWDYYLLNYTYKLWWQLCRESGCYTPGAFVKALWRGGWSLIRNLKNELRKRISHPLR